MTTCQSCKDLITIVGLMQELGMFFDLSVASKSRFHTRIHEDNVGALLLS